MAKLPKANPGEANLGKTKSRKAAPRGIALVKKQTARAARKRPTRGEAEEAVRTLIRWAGDDPLMIDYHDREWGVPLHDDRALFELLILEGAQAGLSDCKEITVAL